MYIALTVYDANKAFVRSVRLHFWLFLLSNSVGTQITERYVITRTIFTSHSIDIWISICDVCPLNLAGRIVSPRLLFFMRSNPNDLIRANFVSVIDLIFDLIFRMLDAYRKPKWKCFYVKCSFSSASMSSLRKGIWHFAYV